MIRAPSITIRLTALFCAVAVAVLLAFGHVVDSLVSGHFEMLDQSELDGKLQLVRHALAKPGAPGNPDAVRAELSDALIGHPGLSVVVAAPDGATLFASDADDVAAHLARLAVQDGPPRGASTRVIEHGGHVYRAVVAPLGDGSTRSPSTVVTIALDISHHRDFLNRFHAQLWWTIGAGVGFAGLLGWLAARRGLAPLRRMARVTRGISARRLGERLPVESFPAELTELATAYNGMLERLEDSFRRLSEFSSDLAHELRTPIGSLMMQTQVVLSKARTADEYREVLYSNLEEHERLARTITDMLYLANADHGLLVPDSQPVELADEVRELFAFYDALAEERGIGLSLSGEGVVHGDRLMIRRALSNLLSNAIRHTPANATVRVAIAGSDDAGVRVSVENPGPAIDAAHLPRLFDRFYRVDASRARGSDGAGLGLAITKSIVHAHRGTIGVSSIDGCTRFEIGFPGADRSRGS